MTSSICHPPLQPPPNQIHSECSAAFCDQAFLSWAGPSYPDLIAKQAFAYLESFSFLLSPFLTNRAFAYGAIGPLSPTFRRRGLG